MDRLRRLGWLVAVVPCLMHPGSAAWAVETKTFVYDARGRMAAAISSGTINSDRAASYCYDKAGNRTLIISNTSGAAASCSPPQGNCLLKAPNRQGNAEFTVYLLVEKISACSFDIALTYSIQHISGPGHFVDLGWSGGSVLQANETSKSAMVHAFESIPADHEMVLQVTFSSSTPGVIISPNTATVTIFSSF